MAAQKKKKLKIVKKPYLTGDVLDSDSFKGALSVFFMMLGMMLLFLILGAVLNIGGEIVSYILNCAMLFVAYSVFYATGMSRGTIAVNQGEIMYDREQTGRPYTKEELSRCFHPAKGVLNGLLGCLPILIVSIWFAVITQKQSYSIGVLPSWFSSILAQRPDLAEPVAFYQVSTGLTAQDILRVIIRIFNMPFVSMLGATNYDRMLLLERLCPVLALIPGIAYGIGYAGGVRVRTKVHSEIAASKRKRRRNAKKKTNPFQMKEKKPRTPKGPEQLN